MTDRVAGGVLAFVVPGLAVILSAHAAHAAARKAAQPVEVMPVSGQSTLHHLGRTIEDSSMGWGGQWSSPPHLLTQPAPGAWSEGGFRPDGRRSLPHQLPGVSSA